MEENGIFLPPLYKLFFTYFEVGDYWTLFDVEKGDDEIYNKTPFLTRVTTDFSPPVVNCLYTEEQIIFNDIEDSNYIAVGYIDVEILLIGHNPSNKDMVFKHRFSDRIDSDPSFVKIAENIFEYAQMLEEVEVDFCKENKHRLYKNWGEDFWRLRNEG
ncbi:MAG: hypothetical protein AB8B69_00420 [Chitinophagales bacterium]